MEKIASLGCDIPVVLGPTYQIYGDILRQPQNAGAIHQTRRQELSYGTHERQKLDWYSPADVASRSASGGPRPVLIFIYGGGFFSGDKVLSAIPGDVAYTNVGQFFAEKFGFDTIVADYRLIGHGAKYPSGGEDIDLVLEWVEKQFDDREDIFILANSAGAVHVLSWLFDQQFALHRSKLTGGNKSPSLKAIGLLGCPFRLDPEGGMKPMLEAYFGNPAQTRAAEPTSLMISAVEGLAANEVAKWPRLMTIVSELDPADHIIDTGREFASLWREKGGAGEFIEIKGHNHISPPLSLGTGIAREEAWGYDFGKWLLRT